MAQDVVKLGEFQDWAAFSSGTGADKVCYVVSQPTRLQGGPEDRQAYVYVTHRPARRAMGVVMVYSGYPYKADSDVAVEIGQTTAKLFTYRDTAWAADEAGDAALVRAMRAGRRMTVTASPAEGEPTTDVYSLSGIAAALKRVGEACPVR